jgi:hypothetical protein
MQIQITSQSPRNGPLTRSQFRRIMSAVSRANAPGKDERIAAARAKRDRRNAKRARDHAGLAQSVEQ